MGSSGKEMYTHLSEENAKRVFKQLAVFHPEKDICCITGEDGDHQRRATFNPRSIVRRGIPEEKTVIGCMTEADRVAVVPNPSRHTRR